MCVGKVPTVSQTVIQNNATIYRMYFVYLLECEDGTIYTGITTDVARRFSEHQQGTASRYTRAKKAKHLIYIEEHLDRSSASKREAQVKNLSREQKLALAACYHFDK